MFKKWENSRVPRASQSAAEEKKSSDTCGIRRDAGLCVRTARAQRERHEEEMEELSFISSAVSGPR